VKFNDTLEIGVPLSALNVTVGTTIRVFVGGIYDFLFIVDDLIPDRDFATVNLYQPVNTHIGDLAIRENTPIENCTYIQEGNVEVENSGFSVKESCFVLQDSYLLKAGTNGTLSFTNSTLSTDNSATYFCGNASFSEGTSIGYWSDSNVTRNFNVVSINGTSPLENATLELYSQNDTLVWNGTTDNHGQADFNVTFTDSNYTDTLRLEAIKGNFSGASNVSFLSDTPLILTMTVPIPGDLNNDSNVSLADLVILAQAYGSKPGNSNWNPNVDIDGNGVVGLSDLVILAQHYGQHYP
jgi:hypothetical protein